MNNKDQKQLNLIYEEKTARPYYFGKEYDRVHWLDFLKWDFPNYTVNPDGSLNLVGNISISEPIPFIINKIKGNVTYIYEKGLYKPNESLKGAPKDIDGNFTCQFYGVRSLKQGPVKITGDFSVWGNRFSDLQGSPLEIGKNFDVSMNKRLKTLEGGPEIVRGNYVCGGCPGLTSLKGAPDHIGGKFINDNFTDEDYREYIKDLHKYDKLKSKHKELEGIF